VRFLKDLDERYEGPPGMRFRFQPNPDLAGRGAIEVLVEIETFNAEKRKTREGITVGMKTAIPSEAFEHPGQVDAMVHECARGLWLHEFDEWFRVAGARAREPHPEKSASAG